MPTKDKFGVTACFLGNTEVKPVKSFPGVCKIPCRPRSSVDWLGDIREYVAGPQVAPERITSQGFTQLERFRGSPEKQLICLWPCL